MARFKVKSFKNDPSVSAEYVKFLIMNTGMDIIDHLGKKLTVVKEKATPMVTDVKVAEAKASNASNSNSTLSKKVDGLVRKVAAWESKKGGAGLTVVPLETGAMTALGLNQFL
jgi:acetyl/propionyl-CoA carboxylase alpha subunit